jgi:glycosyltransferase involved in cell wall biosynthesis
MKILWVKAGGLLPPDTGGRIRSFKTLCEIAKQNEVTFFSFLAAEEIEAQAELQRLFHRVITIPLNLPPPRGIREAAVYASGLLSREPHSFSKYCQPAVHTKLRGLMNEESFDVVVCDFLVTAPAVPWDLPTPKVLFQHNVEPMIWKRHFEVTNSFWWKAISWIEWKKTERAERKYLALADHVVAVSQADLRVFAESITPDKLTVTKTGVDTDHFAATGVEEAKSSLVFMGSMDWLPNEDAVYYFVEQILPLIKTRVPDVTLTVVGRKPSQRLERLCLSNPEVHLTGRVGDVRPFVAKSAVFIVPLRIGGGTRLKIFEAMGMGKAVVSTIVGAEGLPIRNGEHLIIADGPAAFADATVELLENPARRKRLGETARQFVEQNFSWPKVARGFELALEKAARRNASK